MLLLTFGIAVLASRLSPALHMAILPAIAVYLAACVLPAASYAYDVTRSRRGLIKGAWAGAAIAVLLLPALSSIVYGDGRYSISVSVKSTYSSRITAVSYAGLSQRDVVPFVIEHYPPAGPMFVAVPDPTAPFQVTIHYGVKRSGFFGIESGYGQDFKVLLLRVSFEDGTHVFETVTVPRRDEPRIVSVVVKPES